MTDEDKALVERLRDTAEQDATYGYEARGGLFDEAADRIEAQAAEIERLEALFTNATYEARDMMEEIERLRAELSGWREMAGKAEQ